MLSRITLVTLRSKKERPPPSGGPLVKFILAELTVGCLGSCIVSMTPAQLSSPSFSLLAIVYA